MGGDDTMDLAAHADVLRKALSESQTNSDKLGKILGSFDERLSALESDMRPTQERTYAFRKAHVNIDRTVKTMEIVLSNYSVAREVEAKVKEGPKADVDAYLEVMARLRGMISFFDNNRSFKSAEPALLDAKGLLHEAVQKMEGTLRGFLQQATMEVNPPQLLRAAAESEAGSTDSESAPSLQGLDMSRLHLVVTGLQKNSGAAAGSKPLLLEDARAGERMRTLAEAMLKAGYEKQCMRAYKEVRGGMVERGLQSIGVEKLSKEEVNTMQWEELEPRIEGWRRQIRLAVVVFMAERQLCEHVLRDLEPHTGRAFAELSEHITSTLFSFGEAVARTKKTPEKLSVLLDMYETMRNLMPQIHIVFAGSACSTIRNEAQGMLQRLAAAAKEAFNNFEEAVQSESSERVPPDGNRHELTSYVVNYIKYLYDYQATLQELFGQADLFKEVTTRILAALQANMEGKSKLYKDPALTQLFLMNNMHYIVHAVRKSELKEVLGDDWVHRHRRIVQQHAAAYQRTAWKTIFTLLTSQGLSHEGKEGSVNRTAVKERFKSFNTAFEELHRAQCLWKVQDPELRSAVQLQVAEVLLPAYRNFVTRFQPVLEERGRFGGRSDAASKYIRFTEENLETLLNEFFQGRESRNILVAQPNAK